MKLLEAQTTAIKEFERAMKAHGWKDGWNVTTDEIAKSQQPFFYRNGTSLEACLTRVKISGEAKIFYCIYSLSETATTYSGDLPYCYAVTIQMTLYTDDNALFNTGASFHNPYTDYLTPVFDRLLSENWTIEDGGEDAVQSGDDTAQFLTRKILFFSKVF